MSRLDELEKLSKEAIKHSKQYSFEDSDDQIDLANMIMDLGIAVNQLIKVARAAEAYAEASIKHQLWKLSEIELAGYYNNLTKALAELGRGE